MFIILIGSVARSDHHQDSDIDICRIETTKNIIRNINWPEGPINYIDYSDAEFLNLYQKGSLFILHILDEGVLIEGDNYDWNRLKRDFVFIDNYYHELLDIRLILNEFLDEKIYGNAFLAFYSNLYTLIKNFSIFYLARQGIFQFNKKKAFYAVFGDTHYDLLNDSYNKFERGYLEQNCIWDFSSESIAKEVVRYFKAKMEAFK